MLNINTVTCQIGNEEILYISWFDYDPFMKYNFETYFFNIIKKINKGGIKKLVLDCSCRRHDPSDEDFKEIYELFLSGLSATNLEKMARICPTNSKSIFKFNNVLEKLKEDLELKFELKNFSNPEAAFAWLKERNSYFERDTRQTA